MCNVKKFENLSILLFATTSLNSTETHFCPCNLRLQDIKMEFHSP